MAGQVFARRFREHGPKLLAPWHRSARELDAESGKGRCSFLRYIHTTQSGDVGFPVRPMYIPYSNMDPLGRMLGFAGAAKVKYTPLATARKCF